MLPGHDADTQHETAQVKRLKRQNTELKQLNSAKDEFIALASHQLRTPATGVKQYLGMLLEGYMGPIPPQQRDFLQKAYESNERQLSTINDLLQIAQIDSNKIVLHPSALDVAELIDAVANEQKGTATNRRQGIVVRKRGGPFGVMADELRLRMVLDNLVDNASKYSPENTTVTITLSSDDTEVVVEVADQGVGIAPEDLEKLFHKFSRIDNPRSITVGGNGLGLYLAQRIMLAHHGRIDVTSTLQEGSTFTVHIPRSSQKL
ncbi:MAG TPA: HAMP domain-containing sensor histidine kinase [Candidatus Saccharimonadales bacterium]|nr:HAMP domain-containing sensor histidine kinase [Candidatus Saccharimonadales bacterium]